MRKTFLFVLVTSLLAAAAVTAMGATAGGSSKSSRSMMVGMFDDPMTLGAPDKGFPLLKALRTQVVRITLRWDKVATKRPKNARNPEDPAYGWFIYDRAVQAAKKDKIQVLFGIQGTPGWANGRKSSRIAPTNFRDLQNFAYAAARRYDGTFTLKDADTPLPSVRLWLAWNEPNNPVFLAPQFKRIKGRWTKWSPVLYARICNAVFAGVHQTGVSERVACGATDPFGNNNPKGRRPSIAPIDFLTAAKKAGLRKFDAWAHHPYASRPSETPFTKPKTKTTVQLGNIGDLIKVLTQLYGSKPLWVTEYGYQTRPPDRLFGVSWKNQSKYLAQAYQIARRNRRIGMFVWFLIKDERRLSGWQSGLFTANGARKPSYSTFRRLPH